MNSPSKSFEITTTQKWIHCRLCDYQMDAPHWKDLGKVRGNTERFKETMFRLWKCPECKTIVSLDPVDFQDIYLDYPLNQRKFDVFAQFTMKNLLGRLEKAGLKKADRILDYGCGNGLFITFLKNKGYRNVTGYDPFVPEYSERPQGSFDCVIANDVIEHSDDVRGIVEDCADDVNPGGLLYIGTPDTWGVDMQHLDRQIMKLHQPFHRVLVTLPTLIKLGEEFGMTLVRSYRRSYLDTLWPFANYRFLDEFSKALGHNIDLSLSPDAGKVFFKKPSLLFWAFFGWFFPKAYEPAVILRKGGSFHE